MTQPQTWSFRARYGDSESRGTLYVSGADHGGYRTRFVADGKAAMDGEYETAIFVDKDGAEVGLPDPDSAVSRQLSPAARLVLQTTVGFDSFELSRRLPCTGDMIRSVVASVAVGPRMTR